ncbi:MAG: Holliday junction resolvase RuvX [Dehalococcoidia bacterium]|nr:Holliday junction resolvase RuvX [Dehalococcoidia bacterium]
MENIGGGRVLGLDVGERRIGVAISDPDRRFALPLHSIDGRDRRAAIDEIIRIATGDEVGEIVVGLPLSLSGAAGAQAETTEAFAKALEERLPLPLHLWDERLSTQEAQRRIADEHNPSGRGRRPRARRIEADTDALAASIILQAFLDRRRNTLE